MHDRGQVNQSCHQDLDPWLLNKWKEFVKISYTRRGISLPVMFDFVKYVMSETLEPGKITIQGDIYSAAANVLGVSRQEAKTLFVRELAKLAREEVEKSDGESGTSRPSTRTNTI